MKKRGLSPIIATVLLISLVLVLGSIVFIWARGFISEQIEKSGAPIRDLCNSIEFEIELVPSNVGYSLEVANRGNVPIHNFDIKEIKGGESTIKKFKFEIKAGESKTESFSVSRDADKIIVYPTLIGNVRGKTINKAFTCIDKGKTLNL